MKTVIVGRFVSLSVGHGHRFSRQNAVQTKLQSLLAVDPLYKTRRDLLLGVHEGDSVHVDLIQQTVEHEIIFDVQCIHHAEGTVHRGNVRSKARAFRLSDDGGVPLHLQAFHHVKEAVAVIHRGDDKRAQAAKQGCLQRHAPLLTALANCHARADRTNHWALEEVLALLDAVQQIRHLGPTKLRHQVAAPALLCGAELVVELPQLGLIPHGLIADAFQLPLHRGLVILQALSVVLEVGTLLASRINLFFASGDFPHDFSLCLVRILHQPFFLLFQICCYFFQALFVSFARLLDGIQLNTTSPDLLRDL
mmetsp:Transcript_12990/g.22836  ORF Transcript_12990/g.22836 Transcript_12990/m.22836 type:complete len:308 (-) Transcript_12990:1191-2114(-)